MRLSTDQQNPGYADWVSVRPVRDGKILTEEFWGHVRIELGRP